MGIHPKFPDSPYATLEPDYRWFPADEALRESTYEKLIPPLVHKIRREVHAWRKGGYAGASATSKSLLAWWFHTEHLMPASSGAAHLFRYYFAQQEAIETVVYLYEVKKARNKHDLMRFDSSGLAKASFFDEDWLRFVLKLATGAGKTKVMSLVIAWCYYHRLYEADSGLAANFLVIAPNIIVLDRLRSDFEGFKIFHRDPVIPENGFGGRNWNDDFQLTLHIQDNVSIIRKTGNLFLTNIHRVYEGVDLEPGVSDGNTEAYFLGKRPTGKTNDSQVDLGKIVRRISELVVINDEAHHIHDKSLAWFKSIQDIDLQLKQKGHGLALQVDVTATPKHDNGGIFFQTVCDYPLVEAIVQNVVKHPVLPDEASRAKLKERKSTKFTVHYSDYIALGVVEWRKTYARHEKAGKKAVLFIMTDDTKNCDEVKEYLEETYADLKGAVLVIHTKNNGEISESDASKNEEELRKLREQSNKIDSFESPYKAIVSVLMLKEGWDVRNVTTIVGLRAYNSKSNILPEQTLGRGLRRMYPGTDVKEELSIVGTKAFMDFVESIKAEGVELERRPMGEGGEGRDAFIIEVDSENKKKDLDALDIELPVLTPRIYREYKNIELLDPSKFDHKKVVYRVFTDEEKREIVFRDIASGNVSHTTILTEAVEPDFSSVVGYFTQTIMRELRMVSGYAPLYGKVKTFITAHLFKGEVALEDLNTLRNLSEVEASRTITETFKKHINQLTVVDRGTAEIRNTIQLRRTRPFVMHPQEKIVPKKSVFNVIVGDSRLELLFAAALEKWEDVASYGKNYLSVNFFIDYIDASGDPSNYYPDFIVKLKSGEVVIVETKGREDLDDPLKFARLKTWCQDVNKAQKKTKFSCLYVKEEEFQKYAPSSFEEARKIFV